MTPGYIRDEYKLDGQAAIDAYYSEWAASYDDEVAQQGYRTPRRCADALGSFVENDPPILDIGCGTGLSGAALRMAGFATVDGTDVNHDMLQLAQRRAVYRETWVTDTARPFPFADGRYAAIAAVGVIGVGAAPAHLLTAALEALPTHGHLVFSYNDAALEVPEFADELAGAVESGLAIEVLSERGLHFAERGSYSTVFVLRRT